MKNLMTIPFPRRALASLAACLPFLACPNAQAGVLHTSQASFAQGLASLYGDGFDDLDSGQADGPLARQAGALGYRVNVPFTQDPFVLPLPGTGQALSTGIATGVLRFDQFGAGVRAVGATWFSTGFAGDVLVGPVISLTFTDTEGSFTTMLDSLDAGGFLGYVSDHQILSVEASVQQDRGDAWITVDDLRLGAVPEPGVPALLGVAGAALLLARRRAASRS